jgi:hypothetical protein
MSEAVYCDRCGGLLAEADASPGHAPRPGLTNPGHGACRAARKLEPPRYCAACGRRTVVQVTPQGWSSRCSRHGVTVSQPQPD